MDGDLITRKDINDIQKLLKQNIALSEENNKILRTMQKWNKIAFIAKVIVWAIVLIIPVLLYPYIARFVPGLSGVSTASSTTESGLFGYPSPAQLEKILHPGQ